MQNKAEQTDQPGQDQAAPSEQSGYLEALGIDRSPFSSPSNTEALYLDADREQLLNQLLHLAQSSDLILVVSAEPGSGNSTLLLQFLQRAASPLRCCPLNATADTDEQQLLDKLASCFDLPQKLGKPAILELLNEQARDLHRNDLLPVILVDDTQALPQASLSLLLQLQHGEAGDDTTDRPWRIILFTHPEQTQALMDLGINMHFIHLPPMDEKQISRYLFHRLRSVGFKQDSPFSEKDIAFIHQHAQAKLEQVHQLAHQILIKKYVGTQKPMQTKKKEKTALNIKPGVWISALIVVVLTSVLFFQDRINKLVQSGSHQSTDDAQALPESPPKQAYLLKKIPEPVPTLVDISEKDPATPPNNEKQNPAQPAPKKAMVTDDTQSATAKPKLVAKATEQVPIVESPKLVDQPTKPAVAKPQHKPQAAAKKKTTPPPVPDADKSTPALDTMLKRHNIHGKTWILQQSPSSWTAQLIGSSRPDALYRLAKNNAFQGQTAIYHVLRKKQDWYVLLYGNHSNKEAMRKALQTLPAPLTKSGPWVRQFEAVQAELKRGHK